MNERKINIINAISAYGADVSKWPEDISKDIHEIINKDKELQKIFKEAEKTDKMLSSYKIDELDLGDLQSNIINKAKSTTQNTVKTQKSSNILFLKFKPLHVFAPSGGLIAASILGFWLSFSGTVTIPQQKNDGFLVDPVFYEEIVGNDANDDLFLQIIERYSE